jgi:putative DNA primase/helicase
MSGPFGYGELAAMAKRLGGEVHGGRISCPGPGHSRKDRSLSVWLDGDSLRVHSFSGDDWQLCRDDVHERLGLPVFEGGGERTTPLPRFRYHENERIAAASRAQKAALAGRIWDEATDPHNTPVERYLAGRGLVLPEEAAGPCIRFLDRCPWPGGLVVPAMIARFSPIENDLDPEAPPTAIHRTRLRPDGSGHDGKKMLGPVLGQCIKLSPDENVAAGLHLAEGIETAMGCRQRGFSPIWAAATAGAMRSFPVLSGIECLTVLADHDQAGLSAAQDCAERWAAAGREVFIRWPEGLGDDYADEVRP